MTKDNEILVDLIKNRSKLVIELDSRMIEHIEETGDALIFYDKTENKNLKIDLESAEKKLESHFKTLIQNAFENKMKSMLENLGNLFKSNENDSEDKTEEVQ